MIDKEDHLKKIVREKYAAIATENSKGGCCSGAECASEYSFIGEEYTGKAGHIPDADLGLGCGLPTEYANIKPGDTVVDLGSGAGNDCFVAREETGASGQVIGLDFTQEMVFRARENARKFGFENVTFYLGEIEHNPLADESADVVVSNCVFNLIPDKEKAFKETYRILKTGGHFSISDVVVEGNFPIDLQQAAELYAGCVTGAIDKDEYLKIIENAGFKNIVIQKQKKIVLPPEVLDKYLDASARKLWEDSEFGIFSITVYAEKEKEDPCCNENCCS